MFELAIFVLLANRACQMCGHVHYFVNAPIKAGFQKTRPGHVVFTVHDGLTFAMDAVFVSANPLFIALAVAHMAVALVQVFAWDTYRRHFFDVDLSDRYYADGAQRLRRLLPLAFDLVGQGLSTYLLMSMLELQMIFPAVVAGLLAYLLFTADLRLPRTTRS